MISTRSAGLVIDTVVCLTLAKWETMSGRFGGYLTAATSGSCWIDRTNAAFRFVEVSGGGTCASPSRGPWAAGRCYRPPRCIGTVDRRSGQYIQPTLHANMISGKA